MSRPATIYFDSIDNARKAHGALEKRGISSDLHANTTPSTADAGGFMEKVRDFFGVGTAPDSDHTNAAFLVIHDADDDAIATVDSYGGTSSATNPASDFSTDKDEEQRLRLHEERLSVDKAQVSEGEFRARKEVVTEHQLIDVPTTHEEVYVERRPVSDESSVEQLTDAGEEIRIPVTHEEVRIEKTPVTTEEIVVGKRQVQEKQTVSADVRKERVRFDSDVDVDPGNVTDNLDR